MKKHISAWIVITSFAFSPLARADGATEETEQQHVEQAQEAQEPAVNEQIGDPQGPYGDLGEYYEADEDEAPVTGTQVSASTNSEEKARKKEFWKNIILASVAVVVAVVSILVVSNNNGH